MAARSFFSSFSASRDRYVADSKWLGYKSFKILLTLADFRYVQDYFWPPFPTGHVDTNAPPFILSQNSQQFFEAVPWTCLENT